MKAARSTQDYAQPSSLGVALGGADALVVVPRELPQDVSEYWIKLLELAGVDDAARGDDVFSGDIKRSLESLDGKPGA